MRCQQCGLPDPYHGQGDGLGSCECSRCDCCGAAPDECECGQDWERVVEMSDDPDSLPFDPLCNDPSCPTSKARLTRKAKAGA